MDEDSDWKKASKQMESKLPPPLVWAATNLTVPLFLVLPLVVARQLYIQGIHPAIITSSIVFVSAVLLFGLQVLHPRAQGWTLTRSVFARDLFHSVVWHGALPPIFRGLAFGALTAAGIWFATYLNINGLSLNINGGLWPSQWPWWIQLYLALAIGEFAAYWIHRGCHEFAPLWRIHVLHHSSDELSPLSTGRNHPFNVGASVVAQFTPLFFLGCPPEILVLHGVFTGVNGAVQHANIDVKSGLLNWVISSSELHYWHHSEVIAESNSNYGSNLILWDIVFGTRSLPSGDVKMKLGLPHASPETLLGQLLYPFTFSKWSRTEKAEGTNRGTSKTIRPTQTVASL